MSHAYRPVSTRIYAASLRVALTTPWILACAFVFAAVQQLLSFLMKALLPSASPGAIAHGAAALRVILPMEMVRSVLLSVALVAIVRAALTAIQRRPVTASEISGTLKARWVMVLLFAVLHFVTVSLPTQLAVHTRDIADLPRKLEGAMVEKMMLLAAATLGSLVASFALYLAIPIFVRERTSARKTVTRLSSLFGQLVGLRLAGLCYGSLLFSPFIVLNVALHGRASPSLNAAIQVATFFAGMIFFAGDQTYDAAIYVAVTEGVDPTRSEPALDDAELAFRAR